eukprot:1157218-Pelagomonas_calceolata.AAC.22
MLRGSCIAHVHNRDDGQGQLHRACAQPCRTFVGFLPQSSCVLCRSLRDAVAAAIAGGATMVQVREKSACGGAFLAEVKSVLPVCAPT